jgi:hypothetical protein
MGAYAEITNLYRITFLDRHFSINVMSFSSLRLAFLGAVERGPNFFVTGNQRTGVFPASSHECEFTPTVATADDIITEFLSPRDHCGHPVCREESWVWQYRRAGRISLLAKLSSVSGSRIPVNAKPGQSGKVLTGPGWSMVGREHATL